MKSSLKPQPRLQLKTIMLYAISALLLSCPAISFAQSQPKPAEPAKAEAPAPKPVEPPKPAEPKKAEAPAPKPVEPPKPAEPKKAEALAPKPVEPPKPAEPKKSESPAPKPVEPPKPAEPAGSAALPDANSDAKAQSPTKSAEPPKAEVPSKPPEPAKVEVAPKPPESATDEEPAMAEELALPVDAPPKPVEPLPPAPTNESAAASGAGREGTGIGGEMRHGGGQSANAMGGAIFDTKSSRIGLRASIGIGGFGGHEPILLGPVTEKVFERTPGSNDKFLKVDEDGDSVFTHIVDYDREIELNASFSGGVGVVLLSRINSLLSVSCGVQYSFYLASGEYVDDKNKSGEIDKDAAAWSMSEVIVELHTMEIPLLLRISAEEALGYPIYAEVGPQFGFNIRARRTVYDGGVGNNEGVSILKLNQYVFAVGPVFGVGIDLDRISVDLRAHLGLVKYHDIIGGRPWSITVGVTSFL